jgi:hypothetical protein
MLDSLSSHHSRTFPLIFSQNMAQPAAAMTVQRQFTSCGVTADVTETRDPAAADAWIIQYTQNPPAHIGFDTESLPQMARGRFGPQYPNQLALLQFSVRTATGVAVLLFQMHALGVASAATAIPPSVKQLLQSIACKKYAVDIRNDVKELAKFDVQVHAATMVDLQTLHGAGQRAGTTKLVEQYLPGLVLGKSKKAMLSDWGVFPLNAVQVTYATEDAIVALLLAEVMQPL